MLCAAVLDLTAVVLLHVDDQEILRRLSGRWSCPTPSCKRTYHTDYNPPKIPGICDNCGQALVQRSDDKPETVKARLVVYHQNTEGLIPHYQAQGLLREVPGEGKIEAVYHNILKVLHSKADSSC
jgi:adenylate kinase